MTKNSVLEGDVEDLKIKSIIGFDGTTIDGMRMHPDGLHVVFPLGNKVSVLHWENRKQDFLVGHTNIISAIDISRSGKYVASGQINHIGFKTMVIIWLFESRSILVAHELHKVRIEAVSFSLTDQYLISLGGRDDSTIIVWDMKHNKPLCCAPASKGSQGEATCLKVTNRREECFASGGEGTLSMWKIDKYNRKIIQIDVNVSKLKRTILCMVIDHKDELMYCGSSTGDVLKIKLNYHHDADILDPTTTPIMFGCYAKLNNKAKLPQNKIVLFANGVRALLILDKKVLLVGAGNGIVYLVNEIENVLPVDAMTIHNVVVKQPSTPQLLVVNSANCRSMVSSLVRKDESTVLAGTLNCEIYAICLKSFEKKLMITCHTATIYDLVFPHNFSDVFATASKNDVRIWNIHSMQELLRITVENFSCSGVAFAGDGKSIVTGWNDGVIRAFTPLTGRLIYAILNAHNKGVSAIAITEDGTLVISGGCEGQVRVWNISPYHQTLACTLKEHKGPVSAININKFNDEAVSASTDGTCIIWDLIRHCRKQILFGNTLFMCVKYYPSAVQILTGGSDRKIAYWEVYDGGLIRELEGSRSAGINALDISPDGSMFVTGANDQLIKLWKYGEGITTHVGDGHSAPITATRFSPNGKYIVSTSASGSIFVWECPYDVSDKTVKVEEIVPETPEVKEKKEKKPKKVVKKPEKKEEKVVKPEKKVFKQYEVKPKKAPTKKGEEHIRDLGSAKQEEMKKNCNCTC